MTKLKVLWRTWAHGDEFIFLSFSWLERRSDQCSPTHRTKFLTSWNSHEVVQITWIYWYQETLFVSLAVMVTTQHCARRNSRGVRERGGGGGGRKWEEVAIREMLTGTKTKGAFVLGLLWNRNTRNRRFSFGIYSVFRMTRIVFRSFCSR